MVLCRLRRLCPDPSVLSRTIADSGCRRICSGFSDAQPESILCRTCSNYSFESIVRTACQDIFPNSWLRYLARACFAAGGRWLRCAARAGPLQVSSRTQVARAASRACFRPQALIAGLTPRFREQVDAALAPTDSRSGSRIAAGRSLRTLLPGHCRGVPGCRRMLTLRSAGAARPIRSRPERRCRGRFDAAGSVRIRYGCSPDRARSRWAEASRIQNGCCLTESVLGVTGRLPSLFSVGRAREIRYGCSPDRACSRCIARLPSPSPVRLGPSNSQWLLA
jgi:hypothetical protein